MTTPIHLHRRMSARTIDEQHRAVTPFELLLDLVFVVAVASLVTQLAHATVEGSGGAGPRDRARGGRDPGDRS